MVGPNATIERTTIPFLQTFKHAPQPFSEETFYMLEVSIRFYATFFIAALGIVTNIIVLIVFRRQGVLSNSSTVSLTALGVVDLTCSVLNVHGSILSAIMFYDLQHYFYPIWIRDLFIFTSARPMDMLTQMTCWVTAYAAFERLISVLFPFKVKSIFTPRRSLLVNILMGLIIFILYSMSLFSYFPRRTTMYLGGFNVTTIRYRLYYNRVIEVLFYYVTRLNNIGLKLLSVSTVILCNIVIYWKVNLSHRFRKKSAPSMASKTPAVTKDASNEDENNKSVAASDKKENKEKKLLKMITAVSLVFLLCYTPFVIFSVLVFVVWRWLVDYHPFTEYLVWNLATFFQTINSSSNFFIYYIMSTRFREDFQLLCRRGKSS